MDESTKRPVRPNRGTGASKPTASKLAVKSAAKLPAGASTGTPPPEGAPQTQEPQQGTLAPDYQDEALNLVQPETIQPQNEAEKRAAWRATAASRKLAKKEAQQSAIILLSLIDGLASMAFGPLASMNEFERSTLQEPLERILQRIDLTSSEALAKWSDPILLVMGLTAWASRVMRERQEQHRPPGFNPNNGDDKPPEPKKPEPDNGRTEEVVLVEQMRPPDQIAKGIKGDRIGTK